MRFRKLTCRFALVMASVFAASALLPAVDVTGEILGTVTDQSGASVPGAKVVLRNPATGFTRQAQTDNTGSYEFLAVPVGEGYVVEVTAQGFEKSAQSDLKLLLNQHFRADFKLTVGTATQEVSVTAQAAQVETSSTQLGDTIEDKKMTSLPLNGRSYIDLLGLQTGVVPIASEIQPGDRPVSGTGSSGNVSVNGQREVANGFLVNGGDVQEGRNNGAAIVPDLDSIQEFRLLTNSFDAEYGKFSGAMVSVITKNGTNALHGSGFEFLRNEKLDASDFFDNYFGNKRGAFRRNQFGGTVGGPILRDRLFFFADYQGTREAQGVSQVVSVPSLLERGGDFSDTGTTGYAALGCQNPDGSICTPPAGLTLTCGPNLDNNGNVIVTVDCVRGGSAPGDFPATLTSRLGYPVATNEPYWIPGCTTNTQCVFPNMVIPTAAFSAPSSGTLGFIPNPVNAGGAPFWSSAGQNRNVRDNKWSSRIDLNTQRLGNTAFYYNFDDATLNDPYPGANVPGFSARTPSRAQQFNINDTKAFGPTKVNEARLNWTRMALHLDQPTGGLGKVSSFGFVEGGLGIISANPAIEGMPDINFGQLGLNLGTPSLTTGQFNNTLHVADTFSKILGAHTLKFGGEFRYFQINERNNASVNGQFTFQGDETGNDFADYLIGAPTGSSQLSQQFLDSRTKYFGAFGQDSFKVSNNFTVNYGLRWEASEPFYDTQGKIQAFIPGEQSVVYPNSPRGWVFPGDPGVPKTLGPTRWNNFAPRVGLAYSPGFSSGFLGALFGGPGKTSIRAASGIYYTSVEDLTLFFEVGDAPFGQLYQAPTFIYFDQPYKDRVGTNDPGQRFPYSLPAPSNEDFAKFQPIAFSPGFKTDNRLPYAEHYSFSIQRQLPAQTIFTVGYVGTVGHRLIAQLDFNPGTPSICEQIAAAFAAAGAPNGCGPNGEDQIYTLGSQTWNGTRPYSVTSGRYLNQGRLDFSCCNTWITTIANSSYHSLQTSLSKSLGRLTMLAAYTWSKAMDDSSGFSDENINPFNQHLSTSLSSYDMAHNFVVSYDYQLPFLQSTSGPVHAILGGWAVSGITRFTTGLPVFVSQNDDMSLCGCAGVDRPNYDGSKIATYDARTQPNFQWFSVAPFSKVLTPGSLGNANRRFFHGPGLNNWDLAVHKTTKVGERLSAELRGEFFNAFNHAQFSNPSGNIDSSTFGQVTGTRGPRIGQLALKLNF